MESLIFIRGLAPLIINLYPLAEYDDYCFKILKCDPVKLGFYSHISSKITLKRVHMCFHFAGTFDSPSELNTASLNAPKGNYLLYY